MTWTEFPAGPQLLEGLNVGAVDFGHTGEAPPVFAQAAGAPLFRFAAGKFAYQRGHTRAGKEQHQIGFDLEGKRVALNKGSNVHYLLVRALEEAGLPSSDITPVFLSPADARAAFVAGSIDAWVIWDPFRAAAEATADARTLKDGTGLVANHDSIWLRRPSRPKIPKRSRRFLKRSAKKPSGSSKIFPQVASQFSQAVRHPCAHPRDRAQANFLRRKAHQCPGGCRSAENCGRILQAESDPESDQDQRCGPGGDCERKELIAGVPMSWNRQALARTCRFERALSSLPAGLNEVG